MAVPILIPINVTGGGNTGGLLELTIGNVVEPWRLWFHLILTYLFCGKLYLMHCCSFILEHFCCLCVNEIIGLRGPWRDNMIPSLMVDGIISLCWSTGSSIALLWREMQEYTQRRHAYLMSARHNKAPQATTILVTAIPEGLNTEEALFDIFDRFPGGVSKIWLNRYYFLYYSRRFAVYEIGFYHLC